MNSLSVTSYGRIKTALFIDLQHVPSGDNREQEGTSIQLGTEQVLQPPTIDVEPFDDDDVIESTPTAFAEAQNKKSSRRDRKRTIVDLDLEDQTRVTTRNHNKRNRVAPGQPIINCDHYDLCINLEGTSNYKRENIAAPEPPKEAVFNCPICIGPLVEEVSTKCGHIFCKNCIETAISAQKKCPTCRKKITVKGLIRVFLPSAS